MEYKPDIYSPGKKKDFIEQHKAKLEDTDLMAYARPKKGCRKCTGRGYDSWDSITKYPILCVCLLRKVEEKDRITWKEFKDILGPELTAKIMEETDATRNADRDSTGEHTVTNLVTAATG